MEGIELGMALRWYLTVQLWSLPFTLINSVLFQALPDRGYASAKFLGVLSIGLFTWLGFAWLGVPFDPWVTWIVWFITLAGGLGISAHDRKSRFVNGTVPALQRRFRDCLIVEVVFVCVFAGWIWVVAHDPGIDHTEQPMDFMFLASLWNTTHFPPQDPWLSGFAIGYYYFGYWMMATVAKASQVLPQIAYSLSTASWYGFLWLGAYSVAFNVTALLGKAGDFKVYRRSYAWGAGLISALCVAVMGTLSGVLEFLNAFGLMSEKVAERIGIRNFPDLSDRTHDFFISSRTWWWWRSTRVIHDKTLDGDYLEVITEFPLFSYLLGDNHPHVMNSPVLLLGVLLLLQFMVQGQNWHSCNRTGDWWKDLKLKISSNSHSANLGRCLLGISLLAVGMMTNTWDVLSLTILTACGLAVFLSWASQSVKTLLLSLTVIGLAILALSSAIIFPQYLLLQSPIEGVQVNLFNPTGWQYLLLFWGPLLCICPFLGSLAASKKLFSWRLFLWTLLMVLGISVLILVTGIFLFSNSEAIKSAILVPEGWKNVALRRWTRSILPITVLALLFSFMLASFWSWWGQKNNGDQRLAPYSLLVFCASLALGLIYVVEFLFIVDGFGPYVRMNTVFKLYYQAWPLFGIVLGTTVTLVLTQKWNRIRYSLPMFGIVLLIVGCFYYPIAAVGGQLRFNSGPLTIDSREHLGRQHPDLASALDWIDVNVGEEDVLLEAPGNSYNIGHNRISSLSGRPTLHGWDRHELHWRGASYSDMANGRIEAAATVYESGSPQQVGKTLKNWNISLVYVGPVEREKYGFGVERQELLVHILKPVFESGDIQIFKYLQ